MPCIDSCLYCFDVEGLVVVVRGRGVHRNNLRHSGARTRLATNCFINVSVDICFDLYVPRLEPLLPGIKPGVAVLAPGARDAPQIAQRKTGRCFSLSTKGTLVEEERQRERWVYAILDTQVIERLGLSRSRRMVGCENLVHKICAQRRAANNGIGWLGSHKCSQTCPVFEERLAIHDPHVQ